VDYVKVVSISFENVNTESGWDFIRVYDGDSSSANRIVQLTGNNPTRLAKYYTTQINMFVEFTSDGSVFASGFSASYIATAPGTYTSRGSSRRILKRSR
jgi:CUB domain